MSEALGRAAFSESLRTRFLFHRESAPPVELELIEVQELPGSPSDPDARSFSALFLGPADPALPQQTYSVSHAALGTLLLFIVPIGRDAQSIRYEVVFNRT